MTGLEALKEIFNIIYNLDCGTTFEQDKKLNECRDVLKRAIFNAEKSLKALEIIKEKNVNMFGFKRDIKQLGNRFTYKYYQSNLGNYHSGFDIQELTEEEFGLLKEMLE